MGHKDRRKFSRVATDQVMSFSYVDSPDQLGVSKDFSSGGIGFEVVGCEINLGDVLRVTFNIGERSIVTVGRVVRCTELDPITTDIGLEFIEIDPIDQRLLEENSDQLTPV